MAAYIENHRISRPFIRKRDQFTYALFSLLLFALIIAWIVWITFGSIGQTSATLKILLQIIFVAILFVLGIGAILGLIDNIAVLRAYEIHDEVVLFSNLDKLRAYLEKGGDPNAVSNDGSGDSLLYLAIRSNHQGMIQLLVKWGAQRDIFSDVALGDIDAVRSYLDADKPVDATDGEHHTLLHIAIQHYTNDDLVRLLIDTGSNVNICAIDGNSPLHTAVSYRVPLAVIKAIVNAGADLSIKDYTDGRTPLDTAKYMKNNQWQEIDDIVDYLENIESGAT
ncbi:MAG: hypothetical protein F6K30_18075 [Cyanothece sp. SIO2G6]|nr:hypothetical protein [Cyanothece sp. SIO2G6]